MYRINNPPVPHIRQENAKSCWWAALQMLYTYRGQPIAGPMPLQGLDNAAFEGFKQQYGLKATMTQWNGTRGRWTAQHLEVLLRNHGPMWCAWSVYGYAHIVVLVGVGKNQNNEDVVFVNNPNLPAADTGLNNGLRLDGFNRNLNHTAPYQFMYLPA